MAPKMALKVAPEIPKLILKVILKNKLLPSSTIQYLPKTKLGSLLIMTFTIMNKETRKKSNTMTTV